MNDWAIRKWNMALSKEFTLDRATFLITSIIPLSYVEMLGDKNYIVVNYSDIEKHTKFAKEGCEYLIDRKFAKWGSEYKMAEFDGKEIFTSTSIDTNILVIGEASSLIRNSYYFENILSNEVKKTSVTDNKLEVETVPQISIDISKTISWLDEWFGRYKEFCSKIRLIEKPKKIEAKIKEFVQKVKSGKKIVHTDLLSYLDCVNAMVNEWTDVPERYTDIKQRQVATKVIGMTTAENLLKVVPYFVEHYPSWAKVGYESTNIYMLSFHISTCLTKMNGKKRVKKSDISYDDDKL